MAERTLRGPVIARLTSFGSGSEAGAELVGRMFSIYCTLSLWGLNPYAWTQDYLDACARRGGRPPPDLDPWLPWNMDADRRQALGPAAPPTAAASRGRAALPADSPLARPGRPAAPPLAALWPPFKSPSARARIIVSATAYHHSPTCTPAPQPIAGITTS